MKMLQILSAIFIALFVCPEIFCDGAVKVKPEYRKMRVSAYCSCEKCCQKWSKYKTTASGHKIKSGDKFVAADKNIKFGTIIDIPGYGKVPVLDRGGAIKGDRLDVYFASHKAAIEWGVRYLEVGIAK